MSNRIRILLLTPGQKYMEPCVGSRALKRLESLWRAQYERPQQLLPVQGSSLGDYLMVQSQPPSQAPPLPKVAPWKVAKWLWSQLSEPIRANSIFIITREPRGFNWKKSEANPAVHGFPRRKDTPKSNPYVASFGSKMAASTSSWGALPGISNDPLYAAPEIWDDGAMDDPPAPKRKKKQKPASYGAAGSTGGVVVTEKVLKSKLRLGIWS